MVPNGMLTNCNYEIQREVEGVPLSIVVCHAGKGITLLYRLIRGIKNCPKFCHVIMDGPLGRGYKF